MQEEFNAHAKIGTWKLVERKPAMNVIGSTWTFRVKRNEHGDPIKYKSRLCAQGFSQVPEIDYNATFAPVVEISTIRLLLAYAASRSLRIYQADIPTAYLNAELHDEIYMKQSKGFEVQSREGTDMVCLLKRAIYGLKQSGRQWWSLIHGYIINMGFSQSNSDPCLYYGKYHQEIIFIAIYVDDILIISSSDQMRENTLMLLQNWFNAKIIGPATWILSLHIMQSPIGISMDQEAQIENIINRYGMKCCNPANTPMATSAVLQATESHPLSETDHALYRSIVGSLMYVATCSRPDISFAVGELGRFAHQPTQAHLIAAKRVIRYLQGTKHYKIRFEKHKNDKRPPKLVGYADADFASDVDTRKSVSGHIFTFDGSPVAWKSKRQRITATSTAEAEYIALSECGKSSLALNNIIQEITNENPFPTKIYEDNRAAMTIANGESSGKRTKHIDVKHHHVKDLVRSKKIYVTKISLEEQLADIFTKPLPRERHKRLTSQLLSTEGT